MADLSDWLSQFDDLPPEILLGRIAIYAINDGLFDPEQIISWLQEAGLSLKWVPAKDREVHAYKKASSDLEGYTYELPYSANTARILIRPTRVEKNTIYRAIVREILDSKNNRLLHHTVAWLKCQKPTPGVEGSRVRVLGTMEVETHQRGETPHIQQLLNVFFEKYDGYLPAWDAQKVRGMVRDYIGEMNGVQIKPGAYFVPIAHDEMLSQLAQVVNKLPHDCTMQTMPLVDLVGQRDNVTTWFHAHTVASLKPLIKEISEIREKGGRVPGQTYARLRKGIEAATSRTAFYTSVLGRHLDETDAALDTIRESLDALHRDMANPKDE